MAVSALRDEAGELIGFIATALDIAEQLEAEADRQMLARAVENAGEGIAVLNPDWTLKYANTALARLLGRRKPADVLADRWQSLLDPSLLEDANEMVTAVRKRHRWAGELQVARPDGRKIPVAVTLARMGQADGDSLIIANVRDRTAEEAQLARIRKLTLDAAGGLEAERARLSRELHDELGQTLTAINLNLAWLTTRSRGWGPPAHERLTEVKQFVNNLLESVRSLSTSLRPPILDNRGLLEAVRSYAGEFSRRAGISCRVVAVPSDIEVHDPLATTAFRILQEAMTNVARHSRANKCGIFLKSGGSHLELRVRDNGVGAVPKRLQGVQSLGVAGMRERAASIGGMLTVENRPEGGVCVTARLPWQQTRNGTDE
jgi:PAS domain S-box-containing protein